MIVPVQDDGFDRMVYWAVPGVRAIRIRTEYVAGHEPREVTTSGLCRVRSYVPHEYYLLVEAFAQVRLPADRPPPTREEFRAVCDAHDTVAEVVAALEGTAP